MKLYQTVPIKQLDHHVGVPVPYLIRPLLIQIRRFVNFDLVTSPRNIDQRRLFENIRWWTMFLHPYKAKIVQHVLRVHRHPSLASPSALGQALKLLCQRLYKLLNTTTASIVNGTSKISSLSRDQVRFHTPRVVWAINCLCRSSGHHILPVLVSPWIPRSDHNRFQTLQSSAKEIACKYTESLQEPAPTHTKKRVCRRCYATKQNR